jgi:hypothetical protein
MGGREGPAAEEAEEPGGGRVGAEGGAPNDVGAGRRWEA